jgi:hypothetical protein
MLRTQLAPIGLRGTRLNCLLLASGVLLVVAATRWGRGDEELSNRGKSGTTEGSAAVVERKREGSKLIDEVGSFRITGDRATFISADGQRQYIGLENLNLERIVRTVGDDPDPLDWIVAGTLTEYQGTNYLLVTRAIVKARRSERLP